ncbi:hypothetical protein FAZ95_04095 [Trinickia violacea]|uniref:Uncharacterized protein n=1 Tax=Trinickia violacea TaxID=2571746 RepID=A0A4P8II85_9BURK|nr:hypothetical protein [Trinickia violacea]QCP48442.1 hypothetical protein FAZ95_04095 [Trinickia violacea]
MRRVIPFLLRLIVVALLALAPFAAWAAPPTSPEADGIAHVSGYARVETDVSQALGALQTWEEGIRQRASSATSDAQLLELNALSRQAADEADSLTTA